MDRRAFLKGLAATAAGLLLPGDVAAEPGRRVWALDRTMLGGRGARATLSFVDEAAFLPFEEYRRIAFPPPPTSGILLMSPRTRDAFLAALGDEEAEGRFLRGGGA